MINVIHGSDCKFLKIHINKVLIIKKWELIWVKDDNENACSGELPLVECCSFLRFLFFFIKMILITCGLIVVDVDSL